MLRIQRRRATVLELPGYGVQALADCQDSGFQKKEAVWLKQPYCMLVFARNLMYNHRGSRIEDRPLIEAKMRPDPYAPLARLVSIVLVALEKLKVCEPLSDKERPLFRVIAQELALLAKARQVGSGTPIPSYLQKSFCTLVAIDEQTPPQRPLEFAMAGDDLAAISTHIEHGELQSIAPEVLDRAQEVCYQLLVHLNERRPVTTWM